MNKLIPVFLIIILGVICYANSFNNQFIWDDTYLVVDNEYIRSFHFIPQIFKSHLFTFSGEVSIFYRPLQTISYLIDYSIWKSNPFGYHLTNVLLHILVALCIYWLINILYHNKILSLFTSILFVTHPIHTEVVTYISGRADSTAALFMLLSFVFYIKTFSVKHRGIYILMVLGYIAALLSRESTIIFPILLLLYHYAFKKKIEVKQFLSIVGIVFIYILLRSAILKSLLPDPDYSATLLQRIPGFFVAITNYTRLLLYPLGLHMGYGKELFFFNNPKAVVGLVVLFSLLVYVFTIRKNRGIIFFSILWFFVALLPASNIYPLNAYMAEHWLYLPSISFFLILARGLNLVHRNKNLKIFSMICVVTILVFYSSLTLKQNTYWKEPISFYKRTLRYAPYNSHVYYNLGNVYIAIGNNEEAISAFEKAIEINPNSAKAHANLSKIYFQKRQYKLAVKHCDRAEELGLADKSLLEALESYRE